MLLLRLIIQISAIETEEYHILRISMRKNLNYSTESRIKYLFKNLFLIQHLLINKSNISRLSIILSNWNYNL